MKTYKTVRVDCTAMMFKGRFKEDIAGILNKEAADGWELASTTTQITGLIFKRFSTLLVLCKNS